MTDLPADLPTITFDSDLKERYPTGADVGLHYWSNERFAARVIATAVIKIISRRTARVLTCTPGFGVAPELRCGSPLLGADVSSSLAPACQTLVLR